MATPPIPADPAAIPEVLDLAAIGRLFGMTRSGARRVVLRGELGPHFTVGRRLFLLRKMMLAAIEKRQEHPAPRDPPPVPVPPPWAVALMRRGRRRTPREA